jgi:hypothetical protein
MVEQTVSTSSSHHHFVQVVGTESGVYGMYGPPPRCKRKVKVAGWSAQMYTAFVGVMCSWPGWNALRSVPN